MKTCELRRAVVVVAALSLAACSSPVATDTASKSEPEKAEPVVPVSAKTAFNAMYRPAYAWAKDMLPLTIKAQPLTGMKYEDGKSGMWQATFGSPSLKQYATFTYSVDARPPDIRKGVTAAGAVPWSGPTRDALTFQSSEFAIDSDAAFKTAMEKAAPWVKDHPDVPLNTMSLGAASHVAGPVWSFVWGDKKLGFFQLVSATTGKALK